MSESNETTYYPETQLKKKKPRPPLLGRRIQVVGHAGAGKVSRSVVIYALRIKTHISVLVCVFGEACRGNSGQ